MSEDSLPGLLTRGVALAERLVAENERLRRELDTVQAEQRDAEAENHELASLYIAARQLHGRDQPRHVLDALEEILVNFIGAKTYAIFVRDDSARLRPVLAHGMPIENLGAAAPDSAIARVAAGAPSLVGSGVAPADLDGPPTVAVPLRLGDEIVGVLAVWAFLAHKATLESGDRALFDLISTHAARALEAARLAAGAEGRLDFASLADLL